MNNIILFIIRYLGWRDWSVLVYNSILENIFIVFYIALRREVAVFPYFMDLFCFLMFSFFSTTYGYLINDFADMELDLAHGKANTFHGDSKGKARLIVALFAFLSLLFGLRFIDNPVFLLLWFLWALCATFYSIKPIRLKERGKMGLVVVVIAQRMLPILILFAAFHYDAWLEVSVLTIYVLFRGLSSDLNHQLEDYCRDTETRTQTYAVTAGLKRARKIFRVSLEAEKMLLLLCLLLMYANWPLSGVYGISEMLPVLLVYLVLYAFCWVQLFKRMPDVNPFAKERKDIFQFLHHAFPSVVLPLYLLVILAFTNVRYGILLVIFVIYRKLYSPALIMNSFPMRAVRKLKTSILA